MTPMIQTDAPPLRIDETGAIRVGSSNITLDLVIESYRLGESLESFAEGHPSISLAEVYAAIAYYLAHREELDPYLEAGKRVAQEHRTRAQADAKSAELRARILTRARERGLR